MGALETAQATPLVSQGLHACMCACMCACMRACMCVLACAPAGGLLHVRAFMHSCMRNTFVSSERRRERELWVSDRGQYGGHYRWLVIAKGRKMPCERLWLAHLHGQAHGLVPLRPPASKILIRQRRGTCDQNRQHTRCRPEALAQDMWPCRPDHVAKTSGHVASIHACAFPMMTPVISKSHGQSIIGVWDMIPSGTTSIMN